MHLLAGLYWRERDEAKWHGWEATGSLFIMRSANYNAKREGLALVPAWNKTHVCDVESVGDMKYLFLQLQRVDTMTYTHQVPMIVAYDHWQRQTQKAKQVMKFW